VPCVPSKTQIRQWFVTNYSKSCCLDCTEYWGIVSLDMNFARLLLTCPLLLEESISPWQYCVAPSCQHLCQSSHFHSQLMWSFLRWSTCLHVCPSFILMSDLRLCTITQGTHFDPGCRFLAMHDTLANIELATPSTQIVVGFLLRLLLSYMWLLIRLEEIEMCANLKQWAWSHSSHSMWRWSIGQEEIG
jgi:hypothetical protein